MINSEELKNSSNRVIREDKFIFRGGAFPSFDGEVAKLFERREVYI